MREPVMGLTFEKVWAMFQESDRYMRKLSEETDRKIQKSSEETDRYMRKLSEETDRKIQKSSEETDRKIQKSSEETDRYMRKLNEETARQMRETDRQIRKSNEETNRKIKETNKHIEETSRKIKETNKHIGELGNRFGELAEHLVAPNIIEKFNSIGFHFDDISAGLRKVIHDESSGREVAEFDILLENGDSIVGVEVKAKPSEQDVEDHARRLRILRLNKDKKGDKRKIYGALAGAIMPDAVKTAIFKEGFYAIVQTGDTVKIDFPKDFTPKTW
jgi:chromosome segregation ATPase